MPVDVIPGPVALTSPVVPVVPVVLVGSVATVEFDSLLPPVGTCVVLPSGPVALVSTPEVTLPMLVPVPVAASVPCVPEASSPQADTSAATEMKES
jgi:hypothetical protein